MRPGLSPTSGFWDWGFAARVGLGLLGSGRVYQLDFSLKGGWRVYLPKSGKTNLILKRPDCRHLANNFTTPTNRLFLPQAMPKAPAEGKAGKFAIMT